MDTGCSDPKKAHQIDRLVSTHENPPHLCFLLHIFGAGALHEIDLTISLVKCFRRLRFAVKEVVCGSCNTRQPVAKECLSCGNNFGNYFWYDATQLFIKQEHLAGAWESPLCVDIPETPGPWTESLAFSEFSSLCCFFDDDDSKEIFHCLGCGICRVGGESNFFHCVFCGCCYALQLKDNHKCIAGAMHHNCPVCLDVSNSAIRTISPAIKSFPHSLYFQRRSPYIHSGALSFARFNLLIGISAVQDLFHSTSQVRVLRCGHTLHKKCLDQLLRRPTALHVCPLCSKTLNDHSFTWHQVRTFFVNVRLDLLLIWRLMLTSFPQTTARRCSVADAHAYGVPQHNCSHPLQRLPHPGRGHFSRLRLEMSKRALRRLQHEENYALINKAK